MRRARCGKCGRFMTNDEEGLGLNTWVCWKDEIWIELDENWKKKK